jgi:HEPN domain-containing protein
MNNKDVKKVVEYWKINAQRDYDTMRSLFKLKRYPESLFYSHIVLEKILKGLVVENTKEQAPFTHDLVRLEELAKLDLGTEAIAFLKDVNAFNIRAHYPDYKMQFFKICTKDFAEDYINKTIKLYKQLCQKLKQKK